MVKFIFVCAIVMIVVQQAHSQVRVGAKGGLNYVNNVISQNNLGFVDDGEYRLGYHLGFFTFLNLSDKLTFAPELLFSSKGFRFEDDGSGLSRDGAVHLNYVNMPVLLGYKMQEKINLLAGFELGYLVSARSKLYTGTVDVSGIWNDKLDFGAAVGLRYFLTKSFPLELRYTHGLTSVIKDVTLTDANGLVIENNAKFQNRALQFSVGYVFN